MGAAQPRSLTVEAIATEAGVGKQTLYRWWPSKGAIVSEALAETATERVPLPHTGSLRRDLETFLVATVRQVRQERGARTLRRLAREAAVDDHAAQALREFTQHRRAALRGLLEGYRDQIGAGHNVDLLIDQAYGTIWYRLLLGHRPLDDAMARALATTLASQIAPELPYA